MRTAGTKSSSAATWQRASSTRSGCSDGRVAAAMNVNLWDDGDDLQALVESGAVVEPAPLADSAGAARPGGLMRIALTASLVAPIQGGGGERAALGHCRSGAWVGYARPRS